MTRFTRFAVVLVALGIAAPFSTAAMAQASIKTAAAAPGTESAPMQCWWDTDKQTVQIAEQFTLKITCAVIETPAVKAVPLANQFEPSAIQVAPFEVLGGIHHEDIQAPPRRYFQYEYTLRLIGDHYFGQDIDLPSIKITYNVLSTAGGGAPAPAPGRDLAYVLPPIPLRIESLVPKLATDIRDVSRGTFADAEARRSRATSALVAAAIAFSFSLVLFGLALARGLGRRRTSPTSMARTLSARTVLRGCLRSLGQIRAEVGRASWNVERIGRVLAVLRIAGAVALGRPVTQVVDDAHVPERQGQLLLPTGTIRRKRTLLSAPTTVELINAGVANGNGRLAANEASIHQIRESLRVFNAARYGRNEDFTPASLDAALNDGTRAIRRLRLRRLRPDRSSTVSRTATV